MDEIRGHRRIRLRNGGVLQHEREVPVKPDLYMKVVLTIIAICLITLAVRLGHLEPVARAQTSFRCTGELKANAWGGTEPSIGGYKVDVKCE